MTRDRNGANFSLPAPPRPEKNFPRPAPLRLNFLFSIPASSRPEKSSPRPASPRLFNAFLLTKLKPKTKKKGILTPRPASPREKFPPHRPAPT